MFRDIDRWCKSCVDCAMKKSLRNRHRAPLLPIPGGNAFDRVVVDCLGPFPCSKAGNRYVVVFTEYLNSKYRRSNCREPSRGEDSGTTWGSADSSFRQRS